MDRQVSEDYGEDERERLQEELSAVKRRFSHNKVKRKWVSERSRFLFLPSSCFVWFGLGQAGSELENVKSFTRTNNQQTIFYPGEKHINRNIFGTSNLQNRTYGVSCDE